MNYRTIRRSSTSELVIKEILNSINIGKLKPGDKLPPERKLTKMFGVGRSTLREATSALVLLGYLEVIQGKGTFLKSEFQQGLSKIELKNIQAAAKIIDLVEVREVLECSSVKLAALRAGYQDINRIRDVLEKMKESVVDAKQFSKHDFDFHIAIALSTGNGMIYEMMNIIVEKIHTEYKKFKPKALYRMDQAARTADKILSCVIKGDGDQAAEFMREHLNLVTNELKRVMPELKRLKR